MSNQRVVLVWLARHGQVFRNLCSLVLIQVAIAGVGFLTRVTVANSIGVEAFGELAFAIALGTYGKTFILFGFEKSLVRDLVHFPDRFGCILRASLTIRVALFVMLGTAWFAVAWLCFGVSMAQIFRLMPVILATMLGAFTLSGVYDAWKEMRRHAVYHMIERFFYFGLVWFVVLTPFYSLSYWHVGTFMLITVVLGLALQFTRVLQRVDLRNIADARPTMLRIAKSNVWIWFAAMMSLTSEYFNQIILGFHSGNTVLGEYGAAWLLTGIPLLMVNQMTRIGAEASARNTQRGASISAQRRFLVRYLALMTGTGLLFGLPCVIFARELLLMFRPEYMNAVGTLRILGLLPILYGPYVATLQYVISRRMDKTYFSIVTIVGLISVGLSFSLIPSMGSKGAAISAVISVAVSLSLFLAAAWYSVSDLGSRKLQSDPGAQAGT